MTLGSNPMLRTAHHPRSVLVTGGAGFLGSNLIRYLLATHADLSIVNLDALTYAGHRASLADVEAEHPERHMFVHGNICDAELVAGLFAKYSFDTVIHLAAESHVDRSIDGPMEFIRTNVVGTATLLHAARGAWQGKKSGVRFHHVSTDEVYGSLGATGYFTEDTRYDPSSPYSASKAASDHLVRAWARTFDLPVTITNCSNNYGPYHFPEKLIPLMITRALAGQPLPVYGNGQNVRDWLYVEDHARAIDCVVRQGVPGETYNVGGHNEMTNLDIVGRICDLLDQLRPDPTGSYRRLITFVTDRPGHDLRYAIDATKIERELGWKPRETFVTGLHKTLEWYVANTKWAESVARRGRFGPSLT